MRKLQSYQGNYSKKEQPRARIRNNYSYKPNKTAAPTPEDSAYHAPRTPRGSRRLQEEDHASQRRTYLGIAFFPLTFLYFELLLRLFIGEPLFRNFYFIFFFSLCGGFLFSALCSLPRKHKTQRILTISALAFFAVLFLVEYFCKQFFTFFMGISVMFDSAGEMMRSYFGTVVSMVLHGFYVVILYFVPLVLYCIFFKKPASRRVPTFYRKVVPAILCVACYLIAMIGIWTSSSGIVTNKEYYTSEFNITESSLRFGLVTGFRLDAQYLIFGTPEAKFEEPLPELPEEPGSSEIISSTLEPEEIVYPFNNMNISFNSLAVETKDEKIASMHKYFGSLPGTRQNEYTGLFKGKNLIVLTAEAFSGWVIDPQLTPTLYRLSTKGIQFKDFYQPAWGVSTSDGEYSHLMGLVPKAGTKSMRDSASNNLYFTLGNQLTRQGYFCQAYHNNSHTYYDRNKTHPNLGYSKFIAIGSGLEGTDSVWPRSDLQMMQSTVAEYINNYTQTGTPFHAYYMTVSGHAEYNWSGNTMAHRNKEAVAHLDKSEAVKAYLACNLELEYALKYLVEQLELAGIADDTVIVMTADHYPYGLENAALNDGKNKYAYINELAGHEIDTNAELHQNACIIWSGCLEDMEPIVVDEPTYSLDILPTVSNLFGMEYDSRLMVGRDVLSESDPLVLFRNYSWITDKGYYNASSQEFQVAAGVTFASEDEKNTYIKNISNIVKNKVTYSKYILEEDYYDILFGQ